MVIFPSSINFCNLKCASLISAERAATAGFGGGVRPASGSVTGTKFSIFGCLKFSSCGRLPKGCPGGDALSGGGAAGSTGIRRGADSFRYGHSGGGSPGFIGEV